VHQNFGVVAPGFVDESVGFVPVLQQVGLFDVVHSNVVVFEHAWEEVVDLSGHIQDVANAAKETRGWYKL
jgi:hypothetical protein